MELDQQERFLFKIRNALGVSGSNRPKIKSIDKKNPKEQKILIEHVKKRTPEERKELLGLFLKEASALNLNVLPVKNVDSAAKEIASLAGEKSPEWGEVKQLVAWKHDLIEKLSLEKTFDSLGLAIPVCYIDSPKEGELEDQAVNKTLKQVANSYIGITSADYCLAETATVVMKTRKGQARSVSLVPLIHICVIELDRFILNLKELYALLENDPEEMDEGLTNCMTFISGPSKTADIEGVMIHGAHGPREMYIYAITG